MQAHQSRLKPVPKGLLDLAIIDIEDVRAVWKVGSQHAHGHITVGKEGPRPLDRDSHSTAAPALAPGGDEHPD